MPTNITASMPGKRELQEHEVNVVNGGLFPILIVSVKAVASSTAGKSAALAVAGAGAAAVGYFTNRE